MRKGAPSLSPLDPSLPHPLPPAGKAKRFALQWGQVLSLLKKTKRLTDKQVCQSVCFVTNLRVTGSPLRKEREGGGERGRGERGGGGGRKPLSSRKGVFSLLRLLFPPSAYFLIVTVSTSSWAVRFSAMAVLRTRIRLRSLPVSTTMVSSCMLSTLPIMPPMVTTSSAT